MSTNPRVLNRWVIVVGALMMQLALGAIYAWSAFTKLLIESAGGYDFTASQAAWVFSASLAVFVIVMVYAGRWQARIGPRPVALLGGASPWVRDTSSAACSTLPTCSDCRECRACS